MMEFDRVVQLVATTLLADSTLVTTYGCSISREPALPPGGVPTDPANYPIIEVGLQATAPVTTTNAKRVHQNVVVRVSIWVTLAAGQGRDLMRTVGDRVDSLLDGLSGTIDGVNVVKLRFESAIDTTDEYNRAYYPHLVLLYYTEASRA